jgi:CRISPR-associated endonuclease Csn1
LEKRLNSLKISHRPNHSPAGALHEATAYGLIKNAGPGEPNLVYRKAIDALTSEAIAHVRDRNLRNSLMAIAQAAKGNAKDLRERLIAFCSERDHPMRHVRIQRTRAEFIRVYDRRGRPYKMLLSDGIHAVDIYTDKQGRWRGEGINSFNANRPDWKSEYTADPSNRFVMRLHKGDMIVALHNGMERLFRVLKLEPSNSRLVLVEHNEGGNIERRQKDKSDPFQWLQKSYNELKAIGARRVGVNLLGNVRDPGPPS